MRNSVDDHGTPSLSEEAVTEPEEVGGVFHTEHESVAPTQVSALVVLKYTLLLSA